MPKFDPREYESFPEHIAFVAKDADTLDRLQLLLNVIQKAKHELCDDFLAQASSHLTEAEQSRFWCPTEEEQSEKMEDWWATPLPERHQSPHLRAPWRLDAALTVTRDCEYELVDVVPVDDLHQVRFFTLGHPYGGTESLIVLIEGFGHRVTGEDDGTGYQDYVRIERLWKSKRLST